MSPGATFERVYNELKRMLAEGELPPGTPVEPALIGKQIASSITPVRDALHRLTGERLIEAPDHNGFRVPRFTEASLRDLYSWRARLLALSTRSVSAGAVADQACVSTDGRNVSEATGHLFLEIARTSGSVEHVQAIGQLNERLAPMQRAELHVFDDAVEEYVQLRDSLHSGDRREFPVSLARYHRRRVRAVVDILLALHLPS